VVCEHLFVTSQVHRYPQFQRALKTGNAPLALAAAAELRHVDLADALSLTLLVRDDDPLRYERAAVRWLSRYTAEDRQLCLAEAREAARQAKLKGGRSYCQADPPVAVVALLRAGSLSHRGGSPGCGTRLEVTLRYS
jgi:hypothetical protein